MSTFRKLNFLLILVLSVFLIGSGAAFAKTPQDTLVIAEQEHPASFDPAAAYNSTVQRMMLTAYDSLLEYESGTTNLKPGLAKDWEISEDGKTYTLWLREGVKFHDGSELTAEDVKYAFNRAKALGIGIAGDLSNYEKTEIVNDYTVKIQLSEVYAPFLKFLGKVYIPNKDKLEENEKDGDYGKAWLKNHEAGSGPYELTEFQPEEIAKFQKFDNYWKGWEGNHVSQVIWRFIKEQSSQRLLLEKGDIDIAQDPSIEALPALKENEGTKVEVSPTLATLALYFNTQKGPLKDKRVRQAISYAYDYEAHINDVMEGYATQLQGPVPRPVPYHNDDVEVYKQNLEKARELLDEAGYPDGDFTIDFAYLPVLSEEEGALKILQSACKKLGITVEPRGMTWPSFVDIVANEEEAPMISAVYQYPNYPDVNAYVYTAFHCQFLGEWTNYSWYCNEEVSDLLDKGLTTTDQEKRSKYYNNAQEILVEEAPAIWLTRIDYIAALRSNVNGYAHTAAYQEGVNVYEIYKTE